MRRSVCERLLMACAFFMLIAVGITKDGASVSAGGGWLEVHKCLLQETAKRGERRARHSCNAAPDSSAGRCWGPACCSIMRGCSR